MNIDQIEWHKEPRGGVYISKCGRYAYGYDELQLRNYRDKLRILYYIDFVNGKKIGGISGDHKATNE